MEFSDPYLFYREVVPCNDYVCFERLAVNVFVAATNSELVFYRFDDVLVELYRKKVYSRILDLKCFQSLVFVSGECSLDIIRFEGEGVTILQSIVISKKPKISRFDVGYKISVCDVGIVASALQENLYLIPLFGNNARYDNRYIMRIPNSVIWCVDIVGKESPDDEHTYIALIVSNENGKNDLRLLKTDFRSETKRLSSITPANQNEEMLLTQVRSTPSKNGYFVTVHGQHITLFRAFQDQLEQVREIRVEEVGRNTLLTSLQWCGRDERLVLGFENGDIFSLSNFTNLGTQSTEKKRVFSGLPVCSFICDLTSAEESGIGGESDEELEVDGEAKDSISTYPSPPNLPVEEEEEEEEEESDEDEDDDTNVTNTLLFLFEKSKPLVVEINFDEEDSTRTYTIPQASPALDFDVNQEKKEFLVGTSSGLSHIETGIPCGLMFQSPKNSYPGISRLMICKSSLDESSLDTLVFLSFNQIQSTSILKIDTDGEILPLEQTQKTPTFETGEITIGVGCILDTLVLQITSRKAVLVRKVIQKSRKRVVDEDEEEEDEIEEGEDMVTKFRLLSYWSSKELITHACVSPNVTVLGSNSSHIQLLEVKRESLGGVVLSLRSEAWMPNGEEITCLSILRNSSYFGVGCFSGMVFLYDIQNLVIKVRISMKEVLPEDAKETSCVESLVISNVPGSEDIIILFAGLRNGWIVIQEMFITEEENTIIKRSYAEKVGVEPVTLVPCPNLPFQVSAVSSRVWMVQVGPDKISMLPLSLLHLNNVSKMAPLYTNDHHNTIMTVTKDQRLEIWKMNPSVKFISTEYLRGEECYRVFYLEFLDCYLFFSKRLGCKIGVFYKEHDSLEYDNSIIYQFRDDEIAYGFHEWVGDESSDDIILVKKEKRKVMRDEEEEEEEEEASNETGFKRQYFCVGTTKNQIYKFEITESLEQTSKKRVFRCRTLQVQELKKKRSVRDEEEEDDDDEEEEEEGENRIVYAIQRYDRNFFVASSSERVLLLSSNLEIVSETRVRHFVCSIECGSSKDADNERDRRRLDNRKNLDQSFLDTPTPTKPRKTGFSEKLNIYVTDRYDSLVVLRIEEFSNSFVYIQSDPKSRSNFQAKVFDVHKDGSSDLLVGGDRNNNECLVLRYKEDELEKKILLERKFTSSSPSGVGISSLPLLEVTNEVHAFSEVFCHSSVIMEDVPTQIKVWRHPRLFDNEMVVGSLLSGKIFQLGVVKNKIDYIIIHTLETILDGFFSKLGERYYVFGRSYLQQQRYCGRDEKSQRILNRDFVEEFFRLSDPMKQNVVELVNKKIESEIMEHVTVDRIMNLLRNTVL